MPREQEERPIKAQVMQIPKALGEIRLPAAKASQNIRDAKEGLDC